MSVVEGHSFNLSCHVSVPASIDGKVKQGIISCFPVSFSCLPVSCHVSVPAGLDSKV